MPPLNRRCIEFAGAWFVGSGTRGGPGVVWVGRLGLPRRRSSRHLRTSFPRGSVARCTLHVRDFSAPSSPPSASVTPWLRYHPVVAWDPGCLQVCRSGLLRIAGLPMIATHPPTTTCRNPYPWERNGHDSCGAPASGPYRRSTWPDCLSAGMPLLSVTRRIFWCGTLGQYREMTRSRCQHLVRKSCATCLSSVDL